MLRILSPLSPPDGGGRCGDERYGGRGEKSSNEERRSTRIHWSSHSRRVHGNTGGSKRRVNHIISLCRRSHQSLCRRSHQLLHTATSAATLTRPMAPSSGCRPSGKRVKSARYRSSSFHRRRVLEIPCLPGVEGCRMTDRPRYPGIRVTANGNQLVSYHTETRIADGGIFYPITPSTEGGELYQQAFAEGKLNVFGRNTIAVEAEGEHAAQGGAIAYSVCGNRVVNYTSGQGVVYGVEQYYHAPGKCSTMVLEVAARALTKHALNVHCGHDDIYGALDTGWIMVFGKDAQQSADQALILRRVTELSLTPGMNIQDGFLTSHLERTFYKHEAALIREYLGAPEDIIDCPTESQRVLFGPKRRRVPKMIDLANPVLLGPVQNQEHYMQGVIARRDNFVEPILAFLEAAWEDC